jgi:hypothetical protein
MASTGFSLFSPIEKTIGENVPPLSAGGFAAFVEAGGGTTGAVVGAVAGAEVGAATFNAAFTVAAIWVDIAFVSGTFGFAPPHPLANKATIAINKTIFFIFSLLKTCPIIKVLSVFVKRMLSVLQ